MEKKIKEMTYAELKKSLHSIIKGKAPQSMSDYQMAQLSKRLAIAIVNEIKKQPEIIFDDFIKRHRSNFPEIL